MPSSDPPPPKNVIRISGLQVITPSSLSTESRVRDAVLDRQVQGFFLKKKLRL